jgi:hypothetical protein
MQKDQGSGVIRSNEVGHNIRAHDQRLRRVLGEADSSERRLQITAVGDGQEMFTLRSGPFPRLADPYLYEKGCLGPAKR